MRDMATFSAALCRGLIEASTGANGRCDSGSGFPRLYAAASLKHGVAAMVPVPRDLGFPRLYAAASLKPRGDARDLGDGARVFRGFMPRPH